MILCTYQPLDFEFDKYQEYTTFDVVQAQNGLVKYGTNRIEDYKVLSGFSHKPIFCFECIPDCISVAVKSKFVLPSKPERFIIFEANTSICYNDIRWNNEFGCVPADECVRSAVVQTDLPYYCACHIVDKIDKQNVLFDCNLGDLLSASKWSGKAKLRGKDRALFSDVIVAKKCKPWRDLRFTQMLESLPKNAFDDNKDPITDAMLLLNKECFEGFYLPVIVRQMLHLASPMFCINSDLARMFVPSVGGMSVSLYDIIFATIANFSEQFNDDDFYSLDDAHEYRTSYVKNTFKICSMLYQPYDVKPSDMKKVIESIWRQVDVVSEQSNKLLGRVKN